VEAHAIMTLRNATRNQQPLPPLKSSRPRLPRGPKPSDRAPDISSRPSRHSREQKENPRSVPVAPPPTLQDEPARKSAQEEPPPDGSARGASPPSSGDRAAPATRYDRDKTRTITVKDAAYRLNRSEDTVYRWLRMGRLRGWQLGGYRCAVMVCAASVEEALAVSFG